MPRSSSNKPQRRYFPAAIAPRVSSGTRAVPDSTETFIPVLDWLGANGSKPVESAERRAEDLVRSNRGIFHEYHIDARVGRRKLQPGLVVRTSTRIGALPLLSPVTGRVDYGLVIEPRFQWSSVGEMLAGMGFRVVPDLLPLPDLPQSERRVPPWILSSIVLERMEHLIRSMQRRFILQDADMRTPKGTIRWESYARTRFPVGRALDVPCTITDLRDDQELRSMIHWVVRRHRESLLGQRGAGIVVRHLIERCDDLLVKLHGSSPVIPTAQIRGRSQRQSLPSRVFKEGLQAIEWTVDERGLAGMSDLSGLAWRMDMEVFFEAWIESIADTVARRIGARLRSGRREQTKVPLDWNPPSLGSQRSLIPDVLIERNDVVVVLDAKYKRHAADIERLGWSDVDPDTREQHRNDVLQALAYSTLFDAPRVVACLAYPSSIDTYRRLSAQGRTFSRARVRTGGRNVELALIAVPLSGSTDEPSRNLEAIIRKPIE